MSKDIARLYNIELIRRIHTSRLRRGPPLP